MLRTALALAMSLPLLAQTRVSTPRGDLIFGEFHLERLDPGSSVLHVIGSVVNKTNVDLDNLQVVIEIRDQRGRAMDCGRLGCIAFTFGLKAGATGKAIAPSGQLTARDRINFVGLKLREAKYAISYEYALAKPAPGGLTFDDESIGATFGFAGDGISIGLSNKTEGPIKIDWNLASYVDEQGLSHRVFHSGVRYIARAETQPPTMVPPGASMTDGIVPIDYVTQSTSSWSTRPLLPKTADLLTWRESQFAPMALGLFLPVEINGAARNYNFVFAVNRIDRVPADQVTQKATPRPAPAVVQPQDSPSVIKIRPQPR
jgi:hypothetical protein